MNIHQKLVLFALICFAATLIVEWFFPEKVWEKRWWHPFSIRDEEGRQVFLPAIPTLIGVGLLVLAVFLGEKA